MASLLTRFLGSGNMIEFIIRSKPHLNFSFLIPVPGFQVPLTEKLSLSNLEKSRISGSIGHCRRPPGQSDTEPFTPMVIESSNHRVMPSWDR